MQTNVIITIDTEVPYPSIPDPFDRDVLGRFNGHAYCSYFFGWRDFKLPFANSNDPFKAHGVWEMPVTVAPELIQKLGVRFPVWTRHLWRHYQKLDVNCMLAPQLRRSVMELVGRLPYI